MSELLPCPFCGNEAKVHKFCDICSIEINFKCSHDTSLDAKCLIGEDVFWVEHECKPIGDEEVPLATHCYVSAREAIEEWNTWTAQKIETCKMSKDKSIIGGDELESLVCSVCGHETFSQYVFGDEHEFIAYPAPNYCPNCGRKVVQ